MEFTLWYLTVGGLLILAALAGSMLKRLPLTSAMFYLAAGLALGPLGAGMLDIDMLRDARLLERFTEVAVVISLFTAGLKLRLPLTDPKWRPALALATAGMVITVAGIALVGVIWLNLSLGMAILLGAVLAPTDPVLASDVQVESADDSEAVRFGLTGEAGLNDGTAFPFVMLALGILGLHEIGPGGARWLAVDVVWATAAGLLTGTLCGTLVGRLVVYLRRVHREAVGLDDLLALGLIALSYGLALLIHSYGFLSVFAAGLALRRIERQHSGSPASGDVQAAAGMAKEEAATHPERAPAFMTQAVLAFNEQLERIGEVGVVLVLGAMLSTVSWASLPLWFPAVVFLLVRPLATFVSLVRSPMRVSQRAFVAWFGVRGVGSIYYLAFAIAHGAGGSGAREISDVVLAVIAISIVLHGVSVTPLMKRYSAPAAP